MKKHLLTILLSGGGAPNINVVPAGTAYNEGSSKISYIGNLVPVGISVGNNSASQAMTMSANYLTADATVSVSAPFKVCTAHDISKQSYI